ncbi:hypothetical protein [Qipengyuania sp. NPDC077563]|uniref:hypothetical protein n=1 Tax=Qipengyuania sp. NPDC077563 TaxID=3364497 RepID=UPI00384DAD2B
MEMQPISEFTQLVRYQPSLEWLDRSGPKVRSNDDLFHGVAGPGIVPAAVETRQSVEETLFVASADAKIWMSKVAMKLDMGVRERLFRQLDMLHDAEEWMDDGKPIRLESFQSLVRSILVHRIRSNPALALMPNGNVLALWNSEFARLSVEFLPCDKVRWAVHSKSEVNEERAAGMTSLIRLREVLTPYSGGAWFDGG